MSWLYTIVFAGLLFSSNNGTEANLPINNSNETSATVANPPDETERFEQTYPLNAGGRVSVSNVNGSIVVDVWERNEVKLEYVKTADDREALANIAVKINAQPDYFRVETDYDGIFRGQRKSYRRADVEYRLTVPRTAVLDEIAAVNGSITITGASNSTKASAVNGTVRAANLRGTANLSTVNGTVVADFDQLQTSGRISLNTVNGKVDLTLPSDANATLKADTVNGRISNDFNLPVRKGEYVGSDLYGKVGTGDVQIRLNSVNGELSIKRRNDGKSANPAVNLLNMRNQNWNEDDADTDEENEDEDNSAMVPPAAPKAPKTPKTPKVAPVPPVIVYDEATRKAVEDAMRQAERELAQMGPDLEKRYAEAAKLVNKLNTPEMQAQLRAMELKYKDALAALADGYYTVGAPSVEKRNGSFAVKGTPKISIEAKDCEVTVRGWDKPEVSYSAVRINRLNGRSVNAEWTVSATKKSDSDVEFKISSVTKNADGIVFDDGGMKTRLEIFVPKKSDLRIKTEGAIRLEGVSGELDLQGGAAPVNVRDSNGKLTVKTVDGRIRVIGFRGAFDGQTTVGWMNLEGDFERFTAQTVNGTIVLTLPENADANIESNSRQVIAEGFALNQQGDGRGTSKWKIGNGGTNYLFNATADGAVIVRSANALKTNQ